MTAARPRPLSSPARRLAEAEALLLEAARMLDSFASPDGQHRALRSIYSPRGVCETAHGEHSPLCLAWQELIVRIAEHLEAARARVDGAAPLLAAIETAEPEQPPLIDQEALG